MPAGVGLCSRCRRSAWLPAGDVDTPCIACVAGDRALKGDAHVSRVIAAAERAVAEEAMEDEAEVTLRGEFGDD